MKRPPSTYEDRLRSLKRRQTWAGSLLFTGLVLLTACFVAFLRYFPATTGYTSPESGFAGMVIYPLVLIGGPTALLGAVMMLSGLIWYGVLSNRRAKLP